MKDKLIGERSLQECKDQVAKDHVITEAAELYASQFKALLDAAFVAGRSKTSWEQFKKDYGIR